MRNLLLSRLDDVTRPATGGKVAPVDLQRGVKTHAILFRATADVTIAGAAGGAVKEEGFQRLINSLQLTENGQPVIDISGRMLAFATERNSKQAANIGTLASAAAQANTILRADFVLSFADIYGGEPSETCFVERDARFPTKLVFDFASDAQAALITGTGLTLNSLTIEIVQEYDPNSQVMPFFIPRVRRHASNGITGSPTGFRTNLTFEAGNRVAEVIAHALSDNATSDAMFTQNVTFRGDKRRFVDAVNFRTLLNELRRFYVRPTPRAGYLPIFSRFYGKLSECILANQDDNWRIEADMTGPGTTNVLDVHSFELAHYPGYTRDLPTGW